MTTLALCLHEIFKFDMTSQSTCTIKYMCIFSHTLKIIRVYISHTFKFICVSRREKNREGQGEKEGGERRERMMTIERERA